METCRYARSSGHQLSTEIQSSFRLSRSTPSALCRSRTCQCMAPKGACIEQDSRASSATLDWMEGVALPCGTWGSPESLRPQSGDLHRDRCKVAYPATPRDIDYGGSLELFAESPGASGGRNPQKSDLDTFIPETTCRTIAFWSPGGRGEGQSRPREVKCLNILSLEDFFGPAGPPASSGWSA